MSEYSSIFLQQYFTVQNPITAEYLNELSMYRINSIICIFEEEKRNTYSKALYEYELYNCFFGDDLKHTSVEQLFKLLIVGRSKEQAQIYYQIQKKLSYSDYSEIINKILQITNKQYKTEELFINEINSVFSTLTDIDIKYILTEMTENQIRRLMCVPRFSKCYSYIANKIFQSEGTNKNHTFTNKMHIARNIGVIGSSCGSGSTFFTLNLACAINSKYKISIVEYPSNKPYLYSYLGLNTKVYNNYYDDNGYLCNHYYDTKSDQYLYTHYTNKNISWVLNSTNKKCKSNFNSTDMLKLLLNRESNINIVDIGQSFFSNSILDIIDIFSLLIVIIDPMVPDLLNSIDFFDILKKYENKSGLNIIFVVNKFSAGVEKKELQNFLYKKPVAYIPYVNPIDIYKAVYSCNLPYNVRNIKKELVKPLNYIINKFILSNNKID